jgi:hypothetical protein
MTRLIPALLIVSLAWLPPVARARAHATRPLEVDHLMIHVAPGAPERAALVEAGFTIAPGANEHEGQGSASVMVELANGFLELVWRDTSVSVLPSLAKVAQRYERQSAWRSSGWAPLGLGFHRAPGAPDSLPFPVRAVRAPWMAPGVSIEIASAADDSAGPRLWVVPKAMAADGRGESDSERRRLSESAALRHANGAGRITAVTVTAPARAWSHEMDAIAAASPVVFRRGEAWLLEVTFDRGRQHLTRDLRPALPLVCHL